MSDTDDVHGWDTGDLGIIARWYLIRGLGLSPVASTPPGSTRPRSDTDWTIEISQDGVLTCDQQTQHDPELVAEGLRLIRHAHPRQALSLRRHSMTLYPQRWDDGR